MSIESAKAFLERVKNDQDFRKELEEQPSAEERTNFVKANKFGFTKEEINSLKDELQEEELDKVAGGGGYDDCGTPAVSCPGDPYGLG